MPTRILIIDDKVELLLTLQTCLEQEGFDCRTATDGLAGLRLAQAERPDLSVSEPGGPPEGRVGVAAIRMGG